MTYISARKGLLNTVNTEYYKKVIENIYKISDELYADCDVFENNPESQSASIDEFIKRLNEYARQHRHEILTAVPDKLPLMAPMTKLQVRLVKLERKFDSDPFLPEPIRSSVVSYLKHRSNALHEVHWDAAKEYLEQLAKDSDWGDLDRKSGGFHNSINSKYYDAGIGQSQVEDKVNKLRLEIQHYFAKYDPL